MLCGRPAAGVQTGQVVADAKPAHRHHRSHDGGARQPVRRAGHHRLHLRRDGHAAVRRKLHGAVLSGGSALELHRLPALVHDRLPRPVRRVDRVHVGLHALLGRHLYSVFPADDDHRQSRGKI